jgi:hypothetical protein
LSFLEPIKMNKYWHIYVSIVVWGMKLFRL